MYSSTTRCTFKRRKKNITFGPVIILAITSKTKIIFLQTVLTVTRCISKNSNFYLVES